MEKMVTDEPTSNSGEPQPPGISATNGSNHADASSDVSKFEAYDPANCSWRSYAERLLNHFDLYDVPDEKRVRILIDRIGNATYEQLRKLCEPDSAGSKTSVELFELLSRHYDPPSNKYRERIKFLRRIQRPTESMHDFGMELRKAAKNCEFPLPWLPEALRTQFTHGIRNDALRSKLYEMEEINFDKVLDLAASVDLVQGNPPPPAPVAAKKENATPVNAPKPAKIAKKTPAAAAPKETPTAVPKKRPMPVKMPNKLMNKNLKNTYKSPFGTSPFSSPYRPLPPPPPFKKQTPMWDDYDDGYGSNQYGGSNSQYGGNMYQNDYSNKTSNQRYIPSTFKPNDSLFFRRS